jgi:hypothetical protein
MSNEYKSQTDTGEVSPLIDNDNVTKTAGSVSLIKGKSPYFYMTACVVVALLVYMLYYSYTCFYENQDLINEPFIEKTIQTGISDDKVFDVETEVNKLREFQENYLNSINKR